MNNKRTITTREQFKINGEIRERTATHIVTGAHGYETLCISGYIVEHNEMGEVIHNSEKLAEDLLPVTCPTCRVIWYHTHEFTLDDFDTLSGKGDFVVTDLKELGNDSNLLIVFYVQIMPDDFVMQLHRF
ncbi:Uncharacterised protein [Klebsiella quasipneumoniae]|uniref:hypothetical protein n=1 Tax=Klebsiella quasipneumoniae TaxID=1463165 RepID=UPI000A267741|nr:MULTISPECIES: hypothetical protein [Klebsiella]SSD92417.1 Uncharacterised protein [Klebsiella quasipneumoniae]